MPLSIEQIDTLRETDATTLLAFLRATGYSLPAIAALVGESDPTSFVTNTMLCALAYDDELSTQRSPLSCLARLFVLGARIDETAYRAALPSDVRARLETGGVVRSCGGGRVTSEIAVLEHDGTYLLSDKLLEIDDGEISLVRQADVVWPMAEWSLHLARKLEQRAAWTSLLDVGCGTGCVSLLVRERYSRIAGFDLNPRAVAFSRLNAAMAASPARYVVADCMEYVEPAGETYDHVVFASPSGPGDDGSVMVTSGGRLGHELVVRFLSERLSSLLSPAGCCQVWGIFAVEERDGSIEALLARSLPPGRFDVEVEAVRSGGLYVSREHIGAGTVPEGCHYVMEATDAPRFVAELRSNGVIEVVSAVVKLRPRPH
jgi:SAM-dependent methyltransferase